MKRLCAIANNTVIWGCYRCGYTEKYERRVCPKCNDIDPPYTELEQMEHQWDKRIFEQCPGKYDAGGCVAKYVFQAAAGGEKCIDCVRDQVNKEREMYLIKNDKEM